MRSEEEKIVNDYLYKNDFNFIDELMVQIFEARENYILQEISESSFKIGVNVDEKRLKEWLKMCEALQNIPSDIAKDIALKCKINRLEQKIYALENKIKLLTLENEKLKEELEENAE